MDEEEKITPLALKSKESLTFPFILGSFFLVLALFFLIEGYPDDSDVEFDMNMTLMVLSGVSLVVSFIFFSIMIFYLFVPRVLLETSNLEKMTIHRSKDKKVVIPYSDIKSVKKICFFYTGYNSLKIICRNGKKYRILFVENTTQIESYIIKKILENTAKTSIQNPAP
jgi:hypothetical protein